MKKLIKDSSGSSPERTKSINLRNLAMVTKNQLEIKKLTSTTPDKQ